MALTPEFTRHIYAQESSSCEVWLMRLIAPSAEFEQINLCANTQDITSNEIEYLAFPFSVTLADENDSETPTFEITLSNVTLEFIEQIRTVVNPIQIELDLVIDDDFDTVQIALKDLKVSQIDINLNTLSMTIIYDDILNVTIPSYFYNSQEFRTLF